MHVIQAHAELDFPIAQNVGVRGATGGVLAEKVLKHALPILGGETDAMQRNLQAVAHPLGVLKIHRAGAIGVVVVPIGHEQALDGQSRILQKQRGYRGIDPSGHAHDDRAGVLQGGYESTCADYTGVDADVRIGPAIAGAPAWVT